MLVNVNSGLRKSVFAALCLAAVGAYVAVVANHYVAFRMGTRTDAQSLERAAELEPGNAEPQWKLGRYSLYVAQNPAAAIANLEIAVALNPHIAQYWLDLASGYQVVGDVQRQSRALEKALRAEPTAPDVAWQVANFYLIESDVTRALPLFRTVMENDPTKVNAALELCWQATKDVDAILSQALPAKPDIYFVLLNLLIESGEAAPASEVWARLLSLKQTFTTTHAFRYFDYLLKEEQTNSAVQVWQALANRSSELSRYIEPGNLIVDGNLEKSFLNGGFDWRYELRDAVQLSVDTSDFHGGNQSLRIAFKGPAVANAGFFQFVPVRPNTDYRFSAYTKAQDIESASGPRVVIVDAYSSDSYVTTDDSLGTTGWRQQLADFKTGPETSMLLVKVARVPGDSLIKGTFWIDDISLVQR
jgi:tetratricopeptide (TPR) repeat protein